jgi:hypothetical protein
MASGLAYINPSLTMHQLLKESQKSGRAVNRARPLDAYLFSKLEAFIENGSGQIGAFTLLMGWWSSKRDAC